MGALEPYLPILLGWAVLLPLASFFIILLFGNKLGSHGIGGSYVATGAIIGSGLLSLLSAGIWFANHTTPEPHHAHDDHAQHAADHHDDDHHAEEEHADEEHATEGHAGEEGHDDHAAHDDHHAPAPPPALTGTWYTLGTFYDADISVNYYIDSLTILMFCMVTFIATCIHFYASGYMHDELHDITDHEVTMADGKDLKRPGRYHRFFQALSLFCFSMLGLVVAGNIAMTFIFWELVGICSYFLIGFYVERKSASTAANKAFIVNRVGDFGMLIGLMILWAGLGTFNFGDIDRSGDGELAATERGLFSQVRPEENGFALQVPDGLVLLGAQDRVENLAITSDPPLSGDALRAEVAAMIPQWREGTAEGDPTRYGSILLIVAGVGIFCGCVGKSAQFPLHVWLPDAMEGPTPVSALVHSATMVAAGVFLVARFFPVFAPEVLLIIACSGCITLFIGASIAIVATDIKRVLAYSTVSQLGYMMLSLGVGGWAGGVMHLVTHAFFKSLLFMCSGSVIHAVHTNDMGQMGGLRHKMPYTAYTMLVGCLAIAGIGIPSVFGFPLGLSGYYSKDAILEQVFSFRNENPMWGSIFFAFAAGGAAMTAFYMFRMWYLTFAGEPRNQKKYDHAHESPKVMYVPLVILAAMAVVVAWPAWDWVGMPSLSRVIEQARPAGIWQDMVGGTWAVTMPEESKGHVDAVKTPVGLIAIATALGGILLASVFYLWRKLDPAETRASFAPIYNFLVHKWYFDELYHTIFVRPTHVIAWCASTFDKQVIDRFLDWLAYAAKAVAGVVDRWFDQTSVDGAVNWFAASMYGLGRNIRVVQTGSARQYVMFILVGMVGLFLIVSFWTYAVAG
ncbi:MAG: proton-conducting transporter membrane subunit [Pirellulaceae bacterium]